MKNAFVFLFVLLFATVGARGQEYHTIPPYAAGIRGSIDGVGANLRYYPRDLFSIEAQLNVSGGKPNGLPTSVGRSVVSVVLAELNVPLYTTQYRMFLGAGMHYGSWVRYKDVSQPEGTFGYDAIAGFEYTFSDMPVSVSIDYKPAVTYLNGANAFLNNAGGLTLRYYLGKWHPARSNRAAERRKWKEQSRK
jgi:hypothetical protein